MLKKPITSTWDVFEKQFCSKKQQNRHRQHACWAYVREM